LKKSLKNVWREYCMKSKSIIAMIIIALIACICVSCVIIPVMGIAGNGKIVASERSVSRFDSISSSGSAEVRYHVSREYRAVVTVDSNLDEYVEVKTKNNTLSIGTKPMHSCIFTKWVVDVYCPVSKGITISGSGDFESVDKITASSFDSNVSGSGSVYGTVECDSFDAKISGSGRINISGNSRNADITISGSGDFYGSEFSVRNADVRVSGSGKARVSVSDYLNANISGSGEIHYYGNPGIDSKISGSGRIRKM
jgi:hypothetical protein